MSTQNPKNLLDFNKCVFPYCNNGKHNNHILFRLPANQDRQKIWLETIDNPLLAGYSYNYLASKAAVCKNHFLPESFKNAEMNKLNRCVYPVRFNVLQSESNNFSANKVLSYPSVSNVRINDYKSNCSLITDTINNEQNYGMYSNKPTVEEYDLIYLSTLSRELAKTNDENMNFAESNFPRQHNNFGNNILCNHRSPKLNSNFESDVLLNNCVLGSNVTYIDAFENPQTETSANSVSDSASTNEQLKKEISVLKKQNMIYKQKLTAIAKSKRGKLHYFLNLIRDRKRSAAVTNSAELISTEDVELRNS